MNTPQIYIILGRAGCGKGTQAKLLMEHFGNLFYISTGGLFRRLAKQETQVGHKVKDVLDNGGLQFDYLATMLWVSEISYNLKEGQGFCLDGAPRRIEEARVLDDFLKYFGRKENTVIILLDISRKEAFDRLTKRRICKGCGQLIPWVGEYKNMESCDKCGGFLEERPDDVPEAINNRLDYFDKEVMKVVKYFKKRKMLVRINGEQPIEKVFQDILAEVRKKSEF